MTAEFIWTLPTELPGGLRHWVNVARAAELAGFHALRIPSGPQRPDPWLLTARLATELQQIRFLVDLRPGLELPAVAAQRAATLQQITGHRLALSLLTDLDAAESRSYGDAVNHDDRFARAGEFLHVLKQTWKGRGTGDGFQHSGDSYRIEGGGLYRPLAEPPLLYVGGGTPAAERLAAHHGHVAFHCAAPAAQLSERIRRIRLLALQQGRSLRLGCRLHLAGSLVDLADQIDEWQALGVDTLLLSSDDALGDPMRIAQEVLGRRRPVARPRLPGHSFTEGVRS